MEGSCDDIGMVGLRLAPSTDDRTPSEQNGDRVFVVAGRVPGPIAPSHEAVPLKDGYLWFHWIDGPEDNQEPIEFTGVSVEVDAAGNESEPSEEIRIYPEATSRAAVR